MLLFFCTKRRAFKIQCTQDGTWLPGACVPVTCDPPPSKFHGLYQCSNGFQFNSECRIKCEDDDSQSVSLPYPNYLSPYKPGFAISSLRTLILERPRDNELFQDQRNAEGKNIIKVEGEPGNIIFMTVVTLLTIICRGLEVTDSLFLDSKWQKNLPQWLYDLARKYRATNGSK